MKPASRLRRFGRRLRTRVLVPLGVTGAGAVLVLAVVIVVLNASDAGRSPAQGRTGCEFYVAPPPAGNDANAGTPARPWASLQHAVASVPDRGCTVWFRPGHYLGRNELQRRFTVPATFRSLAPYRAVLENDGVVVDIDGGRNIRVEGFEFRHSGPEATKYLVIADRRGQNVWSEEITFANNIFHDSFHDDLLKVHNGVRNATVEGNLFYNQGASEQHVDANSVTDVVIRDNIFFNDFAASGRDHAADAKQFIVVKDSNGMADGLKGSRRVTIQRNVFVNWQGGQETFVKLGNDGKPYHEAVDVEVENNLVVGNSQMPADAAFGLRGAKDVTIVNNTVVGDLPAKSYGLRIHLKDANPPNEDVRVMNNVWSDPTGTMGTNGPSATNRFANTAAAAVVALSHDHNLYWNGGAPIPSGKGTDPLTDPYVIVADPGLHTDHADVGLPLWDGRSFPSGNRTIREEFVRLVETYGAIPEDSPAVGKADPATAPLEDILGRPRVEPDIGAYEAKPRAADGRTTASAGGGS